MTKKNTSTPASEDTKRRTFVPIKTDLVDRLTRECENLTDGDPTAIPKPKSESSKLAA